MSKANFIGMVHSTHTDAWMRAIDTHDQDRVAEWLRLCQATDTVAMVTVNMGDDPDRWIGEMPVELDEICADG